MRALNSLLYLDGTLKESLRMYPIFPMVSKQCVEDVHFKGMFIPKETLIITAFYPNHMDEKFVL
uniref:CSON009397 protein n=1 Tax=Culicoides sonorensis TaxID=179676 RepID=A0A336KH57_CULSO